MPDNQPHHDWINVGEFSDSLSATVVSQRVTTEGIPNRMVHDTSGLSRGVPTCWIWVPSERADEAKKHLAQDRVPEDDLTKLALSYPPPDDAPDSNPSTRQFGATGHCGNVRFGGIYAAKTKDRKWPGSAAPP